MSSGDPAESIRWGDVAEELDRHGSARIEGLLGQVECEVLASLYPRDSCFRKTVVMAHHGFGSGEYKYFRYPLPDLAQGLRTAVYPHLVPVANRWNERMGIDVRYRYYRSTVRMSDSG